MVAWTVALLALGILFLTLPWSRRWIDNREKLGDFVVALLATYIGVFVAVDVQRRETERQERDMVRRMIVAAALDIDQCAHTVAMSMVEAMRHGGQPKARLQTQPYVLDAILQETAVMKHMSQQSLATILEYRAVVNSMFDTWNNGPDQRRLYLADMYGRMLCHVERLLKYETQHMDGQISKDSLSNLQSTSSIMVATNDSTGLNAWPALVAQYRRKIDVEVPVETEYIPPKEGDDRSTTR